MPTKAKTKATNKPAPRSRKANPKRTKSGAKTVAPPRKVPKQRARATKPRGAHAGTKQALLIDLLKRKTGATIADIVHATGWQAHSVRGAISGTLKKKLGLTVTSETTEKRGRVYRIVGRIVGRG